MNSTTVFGRLTKDIEIKRLQSDVPYARFNLASRSSVRGGDGEYGTNFFTCVIWREKAERLAKFTKKGDALVVKGSFNAREYDGKTIWELNVEDFVFVSNKEETNKNKELTPLDDDYGCPF